MSKVIVVTRSNEYYQEDRIVFNDAIKDKKNCGYNKNDALKQKVANLLYYWAKNASSENAPGIINKLSIEFDEKAVKAFKMAGDVDRVNMFMKSMTDPYASIPKSDMEVVFVLADCLKIPRGFKILDIQGFIEALKTDCALDGEDNILYFHDKQVLGCMKDEVVYDKEEGIDLTDNEEYACFKEAQKLFRFIAVFGHNSHKSSIFQCQILSREFGKIGDIDKLKLAEAGGFGSIESMREAMNSVANS